MITGVAYLLGIRLGRFDGVLYFCVKHIGVA
jgi:hypothetical protein